MKFPIFNAIQAELKKADTKYGLMPERIEGIHTLKCEVAELDREVHRVNFNSDEMKKEAVQVAAMAVKFLRDICGMSVTHDPGATPEEAEKATQRISNHSKAHAACPVKPCAMSMRGEEWMEFANEVLEHIENYTVPQYGDKGDDRASEYDLAVIAEHIGRYRDRIGSNARGSVEARRDMIKIAHYASFGHDLII
jgi:hypothetical protein